MVNVQNVLNLMNENRADYAKKGETGELAALEVLMRLKCDKFIYHSYAYPYASSEDGITYPGNIKYENGEYFEVTRDGLADEIDLLVITDYRIFVIECKARAGNWKIYDHWMNRSNEPTDKSPITQSEKHARHLYHSIWEYLPDGNENFIVPIVVFVDKASIEDKRSSPMQRYVQVCILNNLLKTVKDSNTPLKCRLNKEKIVSALEDIGKGTLYK